MLLRDGEHPEARRLRQLRYERDRLMRRCQRLMSQSRKRQLMECEAAEFAATLAEASRMELSIIGLAADLNKQGA